MSSPLPPNGVASTRANKLADKLGIQNRNELQALQNLVDNPDIDADEFLKSPAAKLNKLQSKFGTDEVVEYALASSGISGDRSEAIKAVKLKKNASYIKRVSLSQELLNDASSSAPVSPEDPHASSSSGGARSVRGDRGPGAHALGDVPRSGSHGNMVGPAPPVLPALDLGKDDSFGSLTDSNPSVSPSKDPNKGNRARMGKLVDFFGAQDDNVGTLRRIVAKNKETDVKSRNAVPTFLLRVHFANRTHMIVAMPVEASAREIVGHAMRKLMIQDDEELYGLFLIDGKENRVLQDSERVFETVRSWKDGEYIMFRRRGKSDVADDLNGALTDADADGAEANGGTDTGATKQRKVAKLATFFGVSPENSAIKAGQAEIEDLLNMLSDSLAAAGGVDDVHGGLDMAAQWKRQTINENTIFKEGWLTVDGPDIGSETTAWVSLEKGTLHVRYCESRESAISPRDPVLSTLLKHVMSEVPNPAKCGFTLRNSDTGQLMYTCTAASITDRDDWVQIVNKLATSAAAGTASGLSPTSGSGGNSLVPSTLSRTASTRSRARSQRATIDDFEFHRVLGKGKYGKVLLCSHKVSRKVFAIKVIQKDPESEDTARTESEILRSIKHPFIVGLHFAFQNHERLYLVMEYVNGGELFFHLSQSGRFPEKRAKYYAAEVILALQCLHGKGIVYRDLKLENILLDKDGHIKIADFGLSRMSTKDEQDRTFSMAGTLEYFAPEVIEGVNYSFPADWWAFGVILFELLCGYHPFYNPNPEILYQLILRAPLEFPSFTSAKASDLISRLLDRDYKRRLGSGKQGSREIQQHPFFKDIDFVKLFRKELPPPWRPDLTDDFDVKFFDKEFTSEVIEDDDVKGGSGFLPS
ncbi:hypothetical protein H9P43_005601 [Blastocladiella emersonii ATCC 22665]|nr:hypothetical protein H9P43_005601 [Blastocladiella emersonii ATCC 22665]